MSATATIERPQTPAPQEPIVRRDLRWFVSWDSSERLSHRESLRAACEFGRRNIQRRWWQATAASIDTLTEEECEEKLHEIERLCQAAIEEHHRYE